MTKDRIETTLYALYYILYSMFYILLSNSTPNLSIGLDKVPLPDKGSDYGSELFFQNLSSKLDKARVSDSLSEQGFRTIVLKVGLNPCFEQWFRVYF